MSNELISIIVLVAIFVLGTTLPLNMGVLGIVAALQWGMSMVLIAPPIAWLIFVVPGWL